MGKNNSNKPNKNNKNKVNNKSNSNKNSKNNVNNKRKQVGGNVKNIITENMYNLNNSSDTSKGHLDNLINKGNNNNKGNSGNRGNRGNRGNKGNNNENKSYIINSNFKTNGPIIAFGDLHGDWNSTINLLLKANLIKKGPFGRWVWTGKNTFLVQVGDQVDRKSRSNSNKDEASELKIMKFMDQLHKQAVKENGAVLSLIGNHELMNTLGDFSYASPESIKSFGDKEGIGRLEAFRPGGWLAKYMANNRYSNVRVNDWLFIHGGINLKVAENYSLNEINYLIREYLLGNISKDDPKVDFLLHDNQSIFWDRSLSGNKVNLQNVNKLLKRLNIRGCVVGHTPQNDINSIANGKIWRIDIAASEAFGSNPNSRLDFLKLQ